MLSRQESRNELAKEVNRFSFEELFRIGCTRVSSVGELDRLGMAVYCGKLPKGKVISVSSGKGRERYLARAGSIFEAFELWSAEHPDFLNYKAGSILEMQDQGIKIVPPATLQFSLHAIFSERTPISWHPCRDLIRNREVWCPSDLIYIAATIMQPLMHFQSTTNGLASGFDDLDAVLSGLYEVVERDAWTISEVILQSSGLSPERVALEGDLEAYEKRIYDAGARLFVFDVTSDLGIPAFKSIICDASEWSPGMFAGYGCHLNGEHAILRSILEAAQARAVYTSGDRDDLLRRTFLLVKRVNQVAMIKQLQSLPIKCGSNSYAKFEFGTVPQELAFLVKRLRQKGISEIYFKELHRHEEPPFVVVRVYCPQLEPAKFETWQMGPRVIRALENINNK